MNFLEHRHFTFSSLTKLFLFLLSATSAISSLQLLHETKYPKNSFYNYCPGLQEAAGMVFGPNDELYFTDPWSHVIYKYTPGSSVEIFAGSGWGPRSVLGYRGSAKLLYPQGITLAKNGSVLYVAVFNSHFIAKISLKGQVAVLAGAMDEEGASDGSCEAARFFHPKSVTLSLDGSILYVSEWQIEKDIGNNVLRSITLSSCQVKTVAGSYNEVGFKDGPGLKALFRRLGGIGTHPITGNIYISDNLGHAIRVYYPEYGNVSTITRRIVQAGYKDGFLDVALFNNPSGITIDRKGNIYIADTNNNAIRKIAVDERLVSTLAGGDVSGFYDGLRKDAQMTNPTAVKLDKEERSLYFSDQGNTALRFVGVEFGLTDTVLVREGLGYTDGYGSFASFSKPRFLTTDKLGNIYVTDTGNNLIRMITNGTVKTIAGLRITGYTDGWKNQATFNAPFGIEVVGSNLFVCDKGNNVIRMISASGYVSTFAGSGKIGLINGFGVEAAFSGPVGITSDGNGTLYVTDHENCIIRKITPDAYVSVYAGAGGDGVGDGPALQAQFAYPTGIAFDKRDGALYVADRASNYMRKISADGYVSTIAGTGLYGFKDGPGSSAQVAFPWQITLAPDGNIYIADTNNHAIRRMTPGGYISTVTGGSFEGMRDGNTSTAKFHHINGVTFDPSSTADNLILYVVDSLNNAIRKISVREKRVDSLVGFTASPYKKGEFSDNLVLRPSGIAFDSRKGLVYYANTKRHVISSIISEMNASLVAGAGNMGWLDSKFAFDAAFNNPQGLDFALINGSVALLLVADTGNDLIRKINLIDGSVSTVAGNGDRGFSVLSPLKSAFNAPRAVVYDYNEACIYVCDSGNNVIRRIRETSTAVVAGNRSAGYLDGAAAKSLFNQPSGLALLPDGSLLIADTLNHCIRKWNKTSRMVTTFAGTPEDEGFDEVRLNLPIGIAVSPLGSVYVADSGNNAIRSISSGNLISTLPVDSLQGPSAIAFDSEGNLLIADTQHNAIKRFVLRSASSLGPVKSDGLLSIEAIIGMALSCMCGIMAAAYITIVRKRNAVKKRANNNVAKLTAISQNKSVTVHSDATDGATLNASRTVGIAVPGFLEMDLATCIQLADSSVSYGGTAKVIKGKLIDPSLIRKHWFVDVAVKIYESEATIPAENLTNFKYELSLMSAIPDSPYLVKLVGYSNKPMAIVMKYYGLGLVDCLKDSKFTESSQILLQVATDIATGMKILHEKDIIHFDLKPENVMVDRRSDTKEIFFVICDFGFSNFAADSRRQLVAGLKKPTNAGITPRYAAPELFQKIWDLDGRLDSQQDKKIDVFAYGMTLFWLATGQKPWYQLQVADIEGVVLAGQRPDFEIKNPDDIKQLLQAVSEKCCLQDPNDRPTFREILSSLTNK